MGLFCKDTLRPAPWAGSVGWARPTPSGSWASRWGFPGCFCFCCLALGFAAGASWAEGSCWLLLCSNNGSEDSGASPTRNSALSAFCLVSCFGKGVGGGTCGCVFQSKLYCAVIL